MKNEQFKELIKPGESTQLELKENVHKEAIAKTICSFLNGQGGQLLVGVKNKGKILGIKSANKQEKELREYLVKSIVPEAPITVSIEKIDEKEIILVKVWSGSKKPYVFGGSIFYRRGTQTVQASSKEISELIHKRQQIEINWERQPVLGARLDDLDFEEIGKTIRSVHDSGRGKEFSGDILEFLSYHGLFQNSQVTNAAVVLFGKEPTRFIPQCRVRFAVLTYGKTGSKYSEDRYLEGNLFKNIEDLENLCNKYIAFSSEFNKKLWQRTDGYLYPIAALREGIMNALVHCDYSSPSGMISIIIYSDKLEISNYGKLPAGIKLSDLKRNHLSLPQNPDIAHICFLRGYIEKIGRGTLKIIEACKNAGLKVPVWIDTPPFIKLTFYSKNKLVTPNEGVTERIPEGISKGVIDRVEGVIEGVIEGVSRDVKDKMKNILLVVFKEGGLKASEIGSRVEVPVKSIERYIKKLKESALIEFRGAPKTGGYYLSAIVTEKTHGTEIIIAL